MIDISCLQRNTFKDGTVSTHRTVYFHAKRFRDILHDLNWNLIHVLSSSTSDRVQFNVALN